MADRKISDCREKTIPVDADLFALVDSAAGPIETKKLTFANLYTRIRNIFFDTDVTLAANSDTKVASQKATKTYVDSKIPLYALLTDEKANNTAGGTFTSGAWRTRDIQEKYDPNNIVSVSANQFTLAAGTYEVYGSAPANTVNAHKARLQNITDSTTTINGTSEYTNSGNNTRSIIEGQFTIAATKVFEIQHQCSTTSATIGFGDKNAFSVEEIYTILRIKKVA